MTTHGSKTTLDPERVRYEAPYWVLNANPPGEIPSAPRDQRRYPTRLEAVLDLLALTSALASTREPAPERGSS